MPITKTIADRHRAELIAMRRGTSSLDRHFESTDDGLRYDRSNWITLLYDTRNAVSSEPGTIAYRAMTSRGEPLWFVVSDGRKRGYHAETDCPWRGLEMAREARRRRREVRARWDDVRRLAREARTGRRKFEVTLDDAEASPLCALGVRSFMRSIGLGWVRRGPAAVVSLLMLIDEQVGFVLYEAALRQGVMDDVASERRSGAPSVGGTMAGEGADQPA